MYSLLCGALKNISLRIVIRLLTITLSHDACELKLFMTHQTKKLGSINLFL